MRVPFALDLSVGTDIIAYRRLLEPCAASTHLGRLATRFLHPRELRELDRRFPKWQDLDGVPAVQQSKLGVHLAGRWAAKEAAKKAWGATLVGFKDLRVETLPGGEVQVVCRSYDGTGLEPDDQPTHSGCEQVGKLSISHDGDYAVATVIAAPLHPEIMSTLRLRKAEADRKVMGLKDETSAP